MALFSRNKATDTSKETESKAKKAAPQSTAKKIDRDLSGVLLKPRVTEKAVGLSGNNVYTFEVRQNATKYDVRDAIKEFFNVEPVKINIVTNSTRQYKSRTKGRTVTAKGLKKAYVYLKSGDSISLV